jgi:hypothetical protein
MTGLRGAAVASKNLRESVFSRKKLFWPINLLKRLKTAKAMLGKNLTKQGFS